MVFDLPLNKMPILNHNSPVQESVTETVSEYFTEDRYYEKKSLELFNWQINYVFYIYITLS